MANLLELQITTEQSFNGTQHAVRTLGRMGSSGAQALTDQARRVSVYKRQKIAEFCAGRFMNAAGKSMENRAFQQ